MITDSVEIEFSVSQRYGVDLKINQSVNQLPLGQPIAIDVETDEKDKFVGIGLCWNPNEVWYFTYLTPDVEQILEKAQIVGHNVKGDITWLVNWGIKIDFDRVIIDTMIMSYVQNATKESQGLKQLAKEYLALEWPKYREMVGKGAKKLTLDKHPIEVVANYCGMDTVATFRLWQYLAARMTPIQLNIFHNLEMPILRLLYKMETNGLLIDTKFLGELNVRFTKELSDLEAKLRELVSFHSFRDRKGNKLQFNPRSPKQVIEVCHAKGFKPVDRDKETHKLKPSSSKKALTPYETDDFVATLFQHRGLAKLHSSYIIRIGESPTLPIVHPTISQVSVDESSDEYNGIRTGRLSSDYHNIPRRSERGALLRRLFIAPEGQNILCGDYSQIEYRLLAHFTKEPMLLEAFRNGVDVHDQTAKMFGITEDTFPGIKPRDIGKTLNFAAIYGAQAQKISQNAKIDVDTAQDLLDTYWRRLRLVSRWINRVKTEARARGGVTTMAGRWIALPDIRSTNQYERWHAERQSVNFIIQGSAADIIKWAMLSCDKSGYKPILQVHDELLFNIKEEDSEKAKKEVKSIMENVVNIDVPLIADFGYGKNWSDAKDA